jgi:hypothetical protein
MRSVFSTIAPRWFTFAKHGFRVIDLAEMLCNLMADRIPAISHTDELIVATARSIEGHTLRYGGLHALNPDRRASLLCVPDSAVVLGRAPGAGAPGRRRRVGASDIQQHMPNLPYDQGRRQPPGSEPTQHHRKESRLAAELRLFQRYEGRALRVGHGKARQLHRETDEVVPGNNMKPYGGLASAEDRTKLIAFLQSPTTD